MAYTGQLGAADQPRHHCGLFGVFGVERAAEHTHLGLYALQHRGQESAGIAASDGKRILCHKGMGLVSQVFSDPATLAKLTGTAAIGHNRYSTTGSSNVINAQPLSVEFKCGQLAAAHNGNLVNAAELRRAMEARRLDLPDHGRFRDRAAPDCPCPGGPPARHDRRGPVAGPGGILLPLSVAGPDDRRARPARFPAAVFRRPGERPGGGVGVVRAGHRRGRLRAGHRAG